ncbi:MAG: hypothetical protein ACTSSA_04930 [Candidatus Freyarchaeota archaeon]
MRSDSAGLLCPEFFTSLEANRMENPIKNIIITNNHGSCLVSSKGNSIDPHLLAGLMTTILRVGEEIVESEFESITFKGQQIYYLQKDGCLTIVQVSRELPEPVVLRILSDITENFLERYGDALKNWSGDLDVFSDFQEELEKYLEQPLLDSFMYSFWTQVQAEAVILYDTEKEEILFSSLPEELESRKNRAVGGMLFTFANRIAEDFRGGPVDVVVLRGEHKWIVNAVRGRVSLLAIFDREEAHDLTFITDVTKNILESVTNLLGINSKKSNKKE